MKEIKTEHSRQGERPAMIFGDGGARGEDRRSPDEGWEPRGEFALASGGEEKPRVAMAAAM